MAFSDARRPGKRRWCAALQDLSAHRSRTVKREASWNAGNPVPLAESGGKPPRSKTCRRSKPESLICPG
jgi:hypothetical protein